MSTGRSPWDEGQSWRGKAAAPAGYAASKVPLITAYFWIIKLLSTAMGEATSDYMVRTINPVIAVLLGFTGFVIAMVLQFRAKAYNAWIYWLAVVMVAVFGTQAADVLHIKFGVPYTASTAFYAVVLAVIFVLWYRTEGTLSIHSIRTPRRETFYWATVLATFAMGTAVGDLTARTLKLGYLTSGIWFSIAFAAVAVAHWKFRLNPILAFWIAYVLTRPVGASFADWIAFPHSVGGLGVGHGPVALALTVVIAILVAYLAVTRKDVEDPRQAAAVTRPSPRRCHRTPPGRTRPCGTPGSTQMSGIAGSSTRPSSTPATAIGKRSTRASAFGKSGIPGSDTRRSRAPGSSIQRSGIRMSRTAGGSTAGNSTAMSSTAMSSTAMSSTGGGVTRRTSIRASGPQGTPRRPGPPRRGSRASPGHRRNAGRPASQGNRLSPGPTRTRPSTRRGASSCGTNDSPGRMSAGPPKMKHL